MFRQKLYGSAEFFILLACAVVLLGHIPKANAQIIWLDQRKARPRIGGKGPLKHLLKYTGLENMVVGIQSQGKCSWIRDNQPDIWEATHKYLQISGFLNLRLTGQSRDSVASQIGHLPFNYRKMKWAAGHELPSLFFPVEREKLPELVNPGEPIGGISRTPAWRARIVWVNFFVLPSMTPAARSAGILKSCASAGWSASGGRSTLPR